MKDLICIKCGKAVLKNNLCKKHFIEKQRLLDIKDFSLAVCRHCGSYYDGKWNRGNLEEYIADIVRRRTGGMETKINVNKRGNTLRLRIAATVRIAGVKKTEERVVNVFLRKMLCKNCVRLSGGYYEAMLQLRGVNSEKIFETIMNTVDNRYIAGVEKIKNGYDIRVLEKGIAKKLVRMLVGYEIKKSYKHVTTKKGKAIYRDYYSIR